MIFTQYYLDCLSQASYLIGDETTGQAVIVDPRRDIDDYLTDTRAAGLHIIGVINTHFHADFLSGHLELADATGAWIGYGDAAHPDYPHRSLHDGEIITLGDIRLQILATPGHTPESISILIHDHDTPYGVLTGDALFIGDVGRPDLLASTGVSADDLARQLHHSVQHILMGLPDPVRVYPAHGAGSACGKNLSTARESTIGEQRRTNYACHPMSEADFVAVVTDGQPTAPAYFSYDATLNQHRRPLRDPHTRLPALTDDQITAALADGAVIHDARPATDHAVAHLMGSVNIPADGRMAETAGMLLTPDQPVIVLTDDDPDIIAMRLARIGYDHVIGYLPHPDDYLRRHPGQVAHARRRTVAELDDIVADPASTYQILDLRNPGETSDGTIPGARTIPLPQLAARHHELDHTRPVVAYCAGGWRSAVGASYLRHRGFAHVSDLLGGYHAWSQHHLSTQAGSQH
ncbi:Hydroxyacylglutathione hydrolase [Austwickia sp. TVS 96-490-7B]|uniref:MBL fold metallo-hydrolase n=1 Tax=Austwickia sp. TVS 96-490-7B TaxID=2830843 RepID=UPI001C57E850|nr:MBL fold metallo-hydrolase [Austwickia sp. TVS 96-490-7B]MBW3084100.1 Hydroxyacylglutathione hydrolase [Austwickia sp. TVS 96-490-7B]